MNIWKAIFGKQENKNKPLPKYERFITSPQVYYHCPPSSYRTLMDLARLTLDDPTESELRGFRACLEALRFEPAAFLNVAFYVEGGWSAYHALHEVRQLCEGPVCKFASIVLHALTIQEMRSEMQDELGEMQ